jgi:arsenate reductase (glutaredoxin)
MAQTVQVYGLANCDSTQAALKWLKHKNIAAALHNYKTTGIGKEKLAIWSRQLGWEKLLNKRSTTWRSLTKAEQEMVVDESSAIKLMLENTSLIKRPVVEYGKQLLIGFDEAIFNVHFN